MIGSGACGNWRQSLTSPMLNTNHVAWSLPKAYDLVIRMSKIM